MKLTTYLEKSQDETNDVINEIRNIYFKKTSQILPVYSDTGMLSVE